MKTAVWIALSVLFSLIANSHADIEFFDNRDTFDNQFPGLAVEDFEDFSGTVDGGVAGFFNPVDSNTDIPPFAPGDIEKGVAIGTNDGFGDSLLLVTPEFETSPPPSAIMGPNADLDSFWVEFDPPVTAVGVDIISLMNSGTAELHFMNGNQTVGFVNVLFDSKESFHGAVATAGDAITSVVVINEVNDVDGGPIFDFVDNISFGVATKTGLPGDVNCDGEVNLLDVGPFVDVLTSGEFNAKADVNQDGVVDLLDVVPFVELLAGG